MPAEITAGENCLNRSATVMSALPPSRFVFPKIKSTSGMTSKLKDAGEALKDSELRYRRLFEAAQDGVLILDARTALITDVNPLLIKLLGYSREEFLGKALWELGLFKNRESFKDAFHELTEKDYVRFDDLPLETRDGRAINVEFVSNVYGVGRKKVIQCNIRDISQRKQAERSAQQLLQSNQLETLGHLTGGIAHDFNNLLQVILGYCDILEEASGLADPTRMMLGKITEAGKSAKDLTHRLLAFSRRQVLEPHFIDLNESVTNIHSMLSGVIGDHIDLRIELAPDLGTIKADPNQMEQVLMNLATNARDAMPKGGKILFATANVDVDETYSQQNIFVTPGRYVMLTVTDTGSGMDAQTKSRAFDPFFTTKPVGMGTGLGLSTVLGIVKQSGGSIGVQSELGRGTAFKMFFPLCDEPVEVAKDVITAPLRGGTETIFLVDDAESLRELIRISLEGYGYTVLDSGDPAEALRIAKSYGGPLQLLITDVVMPGISGIEMAEQFSKDRPEMKVIYTSGYSDDVITQHGAIGGDVAFLEKPFTRDTLVRTVRTLLDSTNDRSHEPASSL